MYINLYKKNININKCFKYKFFFFNDFEIPFIKNLNINLNVKDDVNLYNIYYFLQNIFFKKPFINFLTIKITEGGLKENVINIKLNIKNYKYIYNFFKIIFILINKNNFKNINIFILNKNIFFKYFLNDLKNINLKNNLNIIKSVIDVNLERNNNSINYFFLFFFKILSLY